jgi:hypothetical protein
MDKQVLPKAFRDAWLKALRSGAYQQGIGVLRQRGDDNKDYFCCLGVAADICDNTLWGAYDYEGHKPFAYDGLYSFTKFYGPNDVLEPDFVQHLISMNDKDKPFTFIADWIEQNSIEGEEKDA